jgi:hypothetical protein
MTTRTFSPLDIYEQPSNYPTASSTTYMEYDKEIRIRVSGDVLAPTKTLSIKENGEFVEVAEENWTYQQHWQLNFLADTRARMIAGYNIKAVRAQMEEQERIIAQAEEAKLKLASLTEVFEAYKAEFTSRF